MLYLNPRLVGCGASTVSTVLWSGHTARGAAPEPHPKSRSGKPRAVKCSQTVVYLHSNCSKFLICTADVVFHSNQNTFVMHRGPMRLLRHGGNFR